MLQSCETIPACFDKTLSICWCRCIGELPRRSRQSARTKENMLRFVWCLLKQRNCNFLEWSVKRWLQTAVLSPVQFITIWSICKSFIQSFSWSALLVAFELNVQIKAWEENACTHPWPFGQQLDSGQSVCVCLCVCVCHACVFAAELTKALTLAFSLLDLVAGGMP